MSVLNLHKEMFVDGVKLIRILGTGTSGEVWLALGEEGNLIALKIYADTELAKANYEYNMACLFNNSNIIKPIGITTFHEHPVIRLPYCEGRSIDGIAAHISEKMIWLLVENISHALTDIHDKKYAHFDIKPSNILWDGKRFLLSDFGSCGQISSVCPGCSVVDGSSYRFDAPEFNRHCCYASDIWSLGATIFYLYMGCHVFNGLGGRAQHKESPVPYMRKTLPELSTLVQRCLDFDYDKRPTAGEINKIARKEYARIDALSIERTLKYSEKDMVMYKDNDFWPDMMIEKPF